MKYLRQNPERGPLLGTASDAYSHRRAHERRTESVRVEFKPSAGEALGAAYMYKMRSRTKPDEEENDGLFYDAPDEEAAPLPPPRYHYLKRVGLPSWWQ